MNEMIDEEMSSAYGTGSQSDGWMIAEATLERMDKCSACDMKMSLLVLKESWLF